MPNPESSAASIFPGAGRLPYRRAIEIRLLDNARAAAEMEDDHHHFAVLARAEGGNVVEVTGRAVRRPWSLCPLAADELKHLVGMPVSDDPTSVGRQTNIRHQCSHMFDLAGLAIAALGRRGPSVRRYDAKVVRLETNLWNAALIRNDGYRLDWHATLSEIVEPEFFRGVSVKAPFVEWMRSKLGPNEFEASLVLRRALFVGKFRHVHDLDTRANAAEGSNNLGGCFVLQPERAAKALRVVGSSISFDETEAGPLPAGTARIFS